MHYVFTIFLSLEKKMVNKYIGYLLIYLELQSML